MKKVDVQCLIYKTNYNELEFYTRGWEMALERIAQTFLRGTEKERVLVMSIMAGDQTYVTSEQRAYLYGALAPLVVDIYKEWGFNVTPKEAIDLLKTDPEIDFTHEVTNPYTGELEKKPLSLADGTGVPREEITEFINRVFLWLIQNGARPMSGDQYKRWKRWKTIK